MSGSFDKIDYSMRPAKYAERRMIRDIFRRSAPFGPAEDYTYVGFGSVWFSDFILFHRSLGIEDMISVESSKRVQKRVEDNSPFRIKLRFERASQAIRKLEWERKHYVWLDYDDQISKEKLSDVNFVASMAVSGTILAVTLRAESAKEFDQAGGDPALQGLGALERFRENFTAAQVPRDIFEDDLFGRPFAGVSRAMVVAEIERRLQIRNRRSDDPIGFYEIASFLYADGVLMTTVVGIFVRNSDQQKLTDCAFPSLPFGSENGLVEIDVPLLTPREFKLLEAQLPRAGGEALVLGSIPEDHASRFARHYRYLPNYAVLEN